MKKKYFNTLLPNSKVKKNLYFCLCSLIKPLSRGPAFHPAVPDALLFAACLRPERHTPNDDRAPPLRSGKYRCGLGILFALSVKGTRPPECLVRRTDIEVEERRVRKQLYISVCQEFFTNFFKKFRRSFAWHMSIGKIDDMRIVRRYCGKSGNLICPGSLQMMTKQLKREKAARSDCFRSL